MVTRFHPNSNFVIVRRCELNVVLTFPTESLLEQNYKCTDYKVTQNSNSLTVVMLTWYVYVYNSFKQFWQTLPRQFLHIKFIFHHNSLFQPFLFYILRARSGEFMFASRITVGLQFLLILELINLLGDYKVKEFWTLIKRYNSFLPHHFRVRLKTMTLNKLRCFFIREKFT